MGILDELLAGGQRQKEYSDFVDRYEQGDPSEGYSDKEVLKRYGEVSHAVPPDQYAQAAQEALGKLSPEERFGARLKLAELPRNSSPSRFRNRCEVTGRPRAYYRKLKMSRISLRDLGSHGLIPGLVKSSW